MTRLPPPNTAALKSAGKIRELQAEIEAWKELTCYIGSHVRAPAAADFRQRPMMLDHQRDIAIRLAVLLTDANMPLGPAQLLTWLREHSPEPGYELEPGYEVGQ